LRRSQGTGTEIISYDEERKEALIRYSAASYDCERAQLQPAFEDGNFYIWCLICSLVPKEWHEEIGGFDEKMEAWEDWDYWVRMARHGKCFTHVARPIAQYRFYTGTRRVLANPAESGDVGRQVSKRLLQYMTDKYEKEEIMPCSGCGSRRKSSPPPIMAAFAPTINQGVPEDMSELVKVELADGNHGGHPISVQGTSYGYRKHGDVFYVQEHHARIDTRLRILSEKEAEPERVLDAPKEKDEPAQDELPQYSPSLEDVRGLNENRIQLLREVGISDTMSLLSMPAKKLMTVIKCTERAASNILNAAGKLIESQ